jgi:hypothetical protein
MTVSNDVTTALGTGMIRMLPVQIFVHPFDALKTQQQLGSGNERYRAIALRLFREGGVSAFYRGFWPQLGKVAGQQVIVWTGIGGMEGLIRPYTQNPYLKDLATSVSISTVTLILNPFQNVKVWLMEKRKIKGSFVVKEGCRGLASNWLRSTTHWTSSLIGYRYFREKKGVGPLTIPQIADIAFRVALLVAAVTTPFDNGNVVRISHNKSLFAGGLTLQRLYRGFWMGIPYHFIHNFFTAASLLSLEKNGRGGV